MNNLKKFLKYGGFRYYCPICGKYSRGMKDAGNPTRKQVRCGFCGSLERHRFLWLHLQQWLKENNSRPLKILHFAPEKHLEEKIRNWEKCDYTTTDLFNERVDVQANIEDLPFESESYDLVICSHVLEHVRDDKKALSELYRVLKKGCTAFILVPVSVHETFEDPDETDPEVLLKKFGQRDHVRCYGPDVIDRIRDAGFNVDLLKTDSRISRKDAERMRLGDEFLYYSTK